MTSPTNWSDMVCAKFITNRFVTSFWNMPIANDLLGKGLNISFVWGTKDNIIDKMVGKLIADCSVHTEDVPFRLFHVDGGDHDPIAHDSGEAFIGIIKHLTSDANCPANNRPTIKTQKSSDTLDALLHI